MNTYYELVTYLNSIINLKEIDDEIINNFKNYNVYLNGERYDRFINHLINLFDDRINNCYEYLYNNLIETNDVKEFNLILSSIRNESLRELELINVNFINDEDKEKLTNFIKANHNEIINRLKQQYNKYKEIVNYLNNCLLN